jgi:hypothetical protein
MYFKNKSLLNSASKVGLMVVFKFLSVIEE